MHSETPPAPRKCSPAAAAHRPPDWPKFAGAAGALTAGFVFPLSALAQFALKSEFHSYIVLMPFIAGYFAWQDREEIPGRARAGWWPVVPLLAGAGLLTVYCATFHADPPLVYEDALALIVGTYYTFLLAAAGWTLGTAACRRLAFPFGLLALMIPVPLRLLDAFEGGLRYASGWAAYLLLKVAGTGVQIKGLTLTLHGAPPLAVAAECSGIHSTMVLIISSLVMGRLFLRDPRRRWVLVLVTLPLGALRNGLRIWMLGELCVHYDPKILDTWVHHRSGPFFFVLSLGALYWIMRRLQRGERAQAAPR